MKNLFLNCLLCIALLPQIHAQHQSFTTTGSSTFTPHSSVIELTVEAIGGGGGGGLVRGTSSRRSGGGGGGAYAKGKILVTPSVAHSLYVGRGGKKERDDSDARHGEDSWFASPSLTDNTTVVRAMGGGTKMHNNDSNSSGAEGGKVGSFTFENNITKPASVGNINIFTGGNGGSSGSNSRGGGGGGAAGSTGNGNIGGEYTAGTANGGSLLNGSTAGNGGVGGIDGGNDNGTSGLAYGGGGGGARKSSSGFSTVNRNGLPGAQGIVVVYWSRIDQIASSCSGSSTTITGFNFSTSMPNGTAVTTTNVTLNGISVPYTIVSNTEIIINLPSNATSGNVIVTTTLGRARYYITVTSGATAPSSIASSNPIHPNYCFGNTIQLSSVGGTTSGITDVWYKGTCNPAFTETFSQLAYGYANMTAPTLSGSTIIVTSTTNDPMIDMNNLGSFNPATYRYLNIRYRVLSGTASNVEIFFHNTTHNYAVGGETTFGNLISDGNWHILSVDMHTDPDYLTGGNILGWRFDWATQPSVTMEIDFIELNESTMIAEGSTLLLTASNPHYPSSGSTDFSTRKIDGCGGTSCASTSINLPSTGNELAFHNENATCYIGANETVHFYHSSGRYISGVRSNATALGITTATIYDDNTPITTYDDCQTSGYETSVLERHWVIQPTVNAPASVILPYYPEEFFQLSTAANSNSNPDDNIGAQSSVLLSKYSGPSNVDASASNNCPNAGGNGNTTLWNPTGSGSLAAPALIPYSVSVPVAEQVGLNTNAMYSQFDISGFSEFWLHGMDHTSPLPVEIDRFYVSCETNHTKIGWISLSEQNCSHYLLERSQDGIEWFEIENVPGSGTSNSPIHYNSTDERSYESIYYRLKQFDFDGKEKLIEIKHLSCGINTESLIVYPNPADGNFTVEIHSTAKQTDGTLIIVDLTGKSIISQELSISRGIFTTHYQLPDLVKGTYFVVFQTDSEQFKPQQLIIR